MPCLQVTPENGPWPLHDTTASRQAEATALTHAAPHALMQRAGDAVARLASALVPHSDLIQVCAGPGNNGGDGLVAATTLHRHGRRVHVHLVADAQRLQGDAAWALHQATAAGVPIGAQALPGADLHIDALLGLGASRAPDGALAAAIAAMNAAGRPVLAVDLPSGLQADTGQAMGVAVNAAATLSLLTLKPGLFTGQGQDHAGRVWFDDLGVAAGSGPLWLSGRPQPRQRPAASHKGSFGDVWVLGGAPGLRGAAQLAARAALAAGAGRVFCTLLEASADAAAMDWPELMQRSADWQPDAAAWQRSTVLCGCGGGTAVLQPLPRLLEQAPRLVLDADALNRIAEDPGLQAALRQRRARQQFTVLTPHPLEAARLLTCSTDAVQANRIAAAQRLAEETQSLVVLKGSGTVITSGRAPARTCINATGNGLLASAGTGDVLAGWLAGSWAQQDGPDSALQAAVQAVWQHGYAATQAAARGRQHPLLASALVAALQRG